MQKSRSRVGLPRNLFKRRASNPQELRCRSGLFSYSLGDRDIARYFLAIHAHASATRSSPSFGVAPTTRGRQGRYTPRGNMIEYEQGGYRRLGIYVLIGMRADKSEQS
eukprot:1532226-Pyramimonas_sp.AAC.1